MSGVTAEGGGGALYKDGDPVTVTLAPQESVSVPAGKTWIVEVTDPESSGEFQEMEVSTFPETMHEGDTVFFNISTTNRNTLEIRGWSL